MKFLGYLTSEDIVNMLKEGRVRITVTVIDPIKEEVVYFENGELFRRIVEIEPQQQQQQQQHHSPSSYHS